MDFASDLADIARATDFSGVAVVGQGSTRLAELATGDADRANGRRNTISTRFATASATKGLTALAIAGLVQSGQLAFDTTLRSIVGDDLPNVDPAVTIEDLLGHTSGVGDYLDEGAIDDIDDYMMDTPVHLLTEPSAYLPMVAAPAPVTRPGTRFAYNNGAYVMLSIAIERAGGCSYFDTVQALVLDRAGMDSTGFFRSDRLPADTALGYIADGRTNVFHLPVRGAGDGGVYSSVGDVDRLWDALFGGRIVSRELVERLTRPRHEVPGAGMRYGLGFWLAPDRPTVLLVGGDTGVSFRSARDPESGLGYTVISNTSTGAWPVARLLDERMRELSV